MFALAPKRWLVTICLVLPVFLTGCPDDPTQEACDALTCPRLTTCDPELGRCVAPDDVQHDRLAGTPSLAFGTDGELFAAAYDARDRQLVFGVFDEVEQRFRYQVIDDDGNVGSVLAMGVFSDGTPCVVYYDASRTRLKFALLREDDTWEIEMVDETSSVGTDISLAIDEDDVVHTAYRDLTYHGLRYARRSNGVWDIEFVDTGADPPQRIIEEEACPQKQRDAVRRGVGYDSGVAVQGTTPIIVYHDGDCGSLRMARKTTDGWTLRVLDGWDPATYEGPQSSPETMVGRFNAVAVDPLGQVLVVYFDATAGVLKALRSPGGSPVIEVVDDGVRELEDGTRTKRIVGQMPSLDFDATGTAVVAHFDASTRRGLLSTRVGDGWSTEPLPGGQEGFSPQIVIAEDGTRTIIARNRTRPDLPAVSIARVAP